MTAASNREIACAGRGMDVDPGLEPEPGDHVAGRLAGIDFDFTTRRAAVAVLRADAGGLDADRPDVAGNAEQRSEPLDSGKEIAAVSLHHRQQQVAAGVAAKTRVFERRQPRQEYPPRFPLVARHRQRAAQDVAGGQHAKLVAQLTGTAAAVEHGDHGVQRDPGIAFESTEQAGKPRAAPETPDIDTAQLHGHPIALGGARDCQSNVEPRPRSAVRCPRSVVRGPSSAGPSSRSAARNAPESLGVREPAP